MTYHHAPEHDAWHTTEELEEYGDMVLMTWRDWKNLRDRVQEERSEAANMEKPLSFRVGYGAALDWVMTQMDETLP